MQTNGSDAKPGAGWSNGDIPAQLYPFTQPGKLALYSQQRRWIGLHDGWSRLGEGGHEHDAITSSSANIGTSLTGLSSEKQARAVRSLIAQLCETFYQAGWATGTGGGCSIRVKSPIDQSWRVFVAPSGIQKEDMVGDDIFELDMDRNVVHPPRTKGLRQSACTPLWYVVYKLRPSAACVIHTHSLTAVQATLIDPSESSDCLRLTHLEMLKGVGNHAYDDVLEIPIIDNRPTEDLLADQLEHVIVKYPKCNAVLVRRHGIYCWGDSWEQAKTQCESFDYLFDCAVKMKQMGVDPSQTPMSGTYRSSSESTIDEPGPKKRKLVAGSGFNGDGAVDNQDDCLSNTFPLLPRDVQYKILLLDIEGCTTSISFVKDVLFPYCRARVRDHVSSLAAQDALAHARLHDSLRGEVQEAGCTPKDDSTAELALCLLDKDVKSPTLKELQGQIWEAGYASGELQGHVYSDFATALEWFKAHDSVKVCIYSSGSIKAQKLLFASSISGDLLPMISDHFDIPSAGPKKEAASYAKIASLLQVNVNEIVFVSDAIGELDAASAAGIGAVVMSVRPGNAPLTKVDKGKYPCIFSLLQLCGA
jgi:methylthioribulose 1-phosphate dehydratase / enolase-phosphatase E1